MNFKQKITPLYIAGALGVVASATAGTIAYITYITRKNKKVAYEAKHRAEQAKKVASHRRTRG